MTFSTPDLCDAHPTLVRIVEPLFKNFGGRATFGGPLVTVKCFEDNSRIKECLAQPGGGRVLVVDGGGSLGCALLGDQLAAQALKNAWAGVIVNGCIRDVDALARMDLGVQALAATPLKSIRKGLGEIDIPVAFGGVTFRPGAYVYADNNGIIVSAQRLE